MESQLYQKIKPMECLQRAREQRMDNMDNIATVIQTSNRVCSEPDFNSFLPILPLTDRGLGS